MNFCTYIRALIVYVKFDLIRNAASSDLRISIQISIQNAILYKNQCKQNNQITFKSIRELRLNFTQILRRNNRTIYS